MNLERYLEKTRDAGESKDARHTRFAKQLGVSLHTIRKWLNGQRRPNDRMKIKIQQASENKIRLADLVRD